MNQPASKEPTMDEILSSIRQIIADDDEAAARRAPPPPAPRPVAASAPLASVPEPARAPAFDPFVDPFEDDEDDAVPTLALTPDQIVHDEPAEEEPAPVRPAPAASAPRPQPERAAFQPAPMPQAVAEDDDDDDEDEEEGAAPVSFASPGRIDPDDVTFAGPADTHEEPVARPRPSIAASAPLPDPTLTSDLADQLLEPAAAAAVGSAFARLNAPRLTPETPVGLGGLTIEAMLRDMLRPMLKDWLDENLPAMVERLVEQEIERASRGR